MKTLFLIISIILSVPSLGQQLSVMTYNIRLDIASDGENSWSNRKEFLVSQLRFYEPGIFGTQEGLPHQISYIDKALTNYTFIGTGREGGNNGEYSALFYDSLMYKALDQGTFWLSETPDEVSKGWDAAYIRICTYALFVDLQTKKHFWVFNTHLDNQGVEARNKGIALIFDKIKQKNHLEYPVILMGDFNDTPDSRLIEGIKTKLSDVRENSIEQPFGSYGTFNAFNFCEPVRNRIDYIFISGDGKIVVNKYGVLTDSKNLRYPSDHFPVYTELQLK